MAKEPQKKTRWYKLIAQAYQTTAPTDRLLLPYMLVAVLVPILIYPVSYTTWQAVDLAMRPPDLDDPSTPAPRS